MTAPLFLTRADALAASRIVLDGEEGRHAADVRRLRVGERVDVGDGAGRVARGVVAEVARGRVVVDVRERVEVPAPQPRFVVVQALARGGRDEDAVELMTELGVDEIVPWEAERAVARVTGRTVEKWAARARAAAKQSRRAWLPVLAPPADTAAVAARLRAAAVGLVLHESATQALASVEPPEGDAVGEVVVVVGPEGGLTDGELAAFAEVGAAAVRLGREVVRASTAGAAALAVLSAKRRWR